MAAWMISVVTFLRLAYFQREGYFVHCSRVVHRHGLAQASSLHSCDKKAIFSDNKQHTRTHTHTLLLSFLTFPAHSHTVSCREGQDASAC